MTSSRSHTGGLGTSTAATWAPHRNALPPGPPPRPPRARPPSGLAAAATPDVTQPPSRRRTRGLGGPVAHPGIQPAHQGVAAQALAAVRQRQFGFRLCRTWHAERGEGGFRGRRQQGVSADSSPSGPLTRIRACSEPTPSRATDSAASFDASPASTRRRKWTRYPERQLVSCSAPRAPAASTCLSASATTARPKADVLRRPSAAKGKTTPCVSSCSITLPCRHRWHRTLVRNRAAASC